MNMGQENMLQNMDRKKTDINMLCHCLDIMLALYNAILLY